MSNTLQNLSIPTDEQPAARSEIRRVAVLAAAHLMRWGGLSSTDKALTSGVLHDHGPAGFLVMAQASAAPPPQPEALLRIADYIETALLTSSCMSLDTDYGPEYRLSQLIEACDLHGATWPNKSSIYITWGGNEGPVRSAGRVSVNTGYHSRSEIHTLVPERGGWLRTVDFHVAAPLRALVVDEVLAGRFKDATFTQW